ncbi:methionyl-tRNA formyltransferase [Xylophilus rhododendri]|uniref:Methionyl-tRNA formyltransferase n=1 Tax=Xylophilus rhododendri TaxID=2697032 RepID=A0A857J6U4_9BURK|nr:methionyl-tRNA formyltransferase [Xylophilus rhododendri]QHI98732.1 methionyl-tRNA formyltransferase [Xylophilus rhododendri]
MKIVFAGTPAFAASALEHLHGAGFEIALVMTQPDRPAGRGMQLQASAVKQFAQAHGLPVAQPRGLRLDGRYAEDAAAAQARLAALRADAMVVAAYGLILPQWVLDLPRLGCFNIHASLLPRWRGAAPIHRAIEAGDALTGNTIMQMDAGLDTGDMLLTEPVPIAPDDSTGSLHDKLAARGGPLVCEVLRQAERGALQPQRQPAEGVTYAAKIDKAEAAIDWSQDAVQIARRVRAFDPFPGASTALDGTAIKIWSAEALEGHAADAGAAPGTVLAAGADGVFVRCGQGVLRASVLQRAGGKRLPADGFLRGHPLPAGSLLA